MMEDLGVTATREYAAGDGDQLRALWSDAGFRLIADDDEGLARFADRNPGLFLIAQDEGRIVASAMGAWEGRRGWLYHVATAPSHRRRGIASGLVALVEDRLRALGCPRALVIVESANEDALAFWSERGYAKREAHQLGKQLQGGVGGL
jgi:ribosomal protein S18 acetylase RimI-like enzyme